MLSMYSYEQLCDLGVFIPAGIDDDGEPLITIDMDRAKEYAPEVYWRELNAIDETILSLVDKGMLRMIIHPEDFSVEYELTEEGRAAIGEEDMQ